MKKGCCCSIPLLLLIVSCLDLITIFPTAVRVDGNYLTRHASIQQPAAGKIQLQQQGSGDPITKLHQEQQQRDKNNNSRSNNGPVVREEKCKVR